MNLAERFTLLVKSSATRVIDQVEDPEASLTQLVAEMGGQLHTAKRATAQAMANERRLRNQVGFQRETADRWAESAKAAVRRGDEDGAREALRQAEQARRYGDELARQLAEQEEDTARIRNTVSRLKNRVVRSKTRLQLLRSRIRQSEARRACGTVLRGVESADLYGEFERLGEKVELAAADEEAFLELDGELSGDSLRSRLEDAEIDDAVEERLGALRRELSEDAESEGSRDLVEVEMTTEVTESSQPSDVDETSA
ncbi:MAG: PspA/IM30 family protein [Thermoanaerobaculia bacterium]|nr:PspA/IM30 family protein [Thermoanaerobaculia bacterium]